MLQDMFLGMGWACVVIRKVGGACEWSKVGGHMDHGVWAHSLAAFHTPLQTFTKLSQPSPLSMHVPA